MLNEIYKSKQLKFRHILTSKLLFLKENSRKTMKIIQRVLKVRKMILKLIFGI